MFFEGGGFVGGGGVVGIGDFVFLLRCLEFVDKETGRRDVY